MRSSIGGSWLHLGVLVAISTACTPTAPASPLSSDAIRIGVPSVDNARPLEDRPQLSIMLDGDGLALERRDGSETTRAPISDRTKEGHLLLGLHAALAPEREVLSERSTGEEAVELWVRADTPFESVAEIMYTAGHAGLRRYDAIVLADDEAGALPLLPPRFDGPEWPRECVVAEVLVEADRLRLRRSLVRNDLGEGLTFPLEVSPSEHDVGELAVALRQGPPVPFCSGVELVIDGGTSWAQVTAAAAALADVVPDDTVVVSVG